MITRWERDSVHYDQTTLQLFALDDLGDVRGEVANHVEGCEFCQLQLETVSRGELSWDEVGGLLHDYKPESDSSLNVGHGADQHDERDPAPATLAALLAPSDRPDSLGRFSRYEIVEYLGHGGMGIVLRGYDPALDRHCAIKVLAPALASSGSARQRFSREAKSAAAVVHPHVVPIQNVDEHLGLPYLVMPVVEGRSLQRRVQQDGPLDTVAAVRIACQVASGLAAAHGRGLVHRDIKPANILLENGVERVQITDFGLARAIDDASMTRSGVIAGTPQYMSPEQAHGDPMDHRSDLFSLGSVMYFMLTGRSPFRAETTMGVLSRIDRDEPRKICSINPHVPAWLEVLVMKLLEKDPRQRFHSADEVATLLGHWQAHLQSPEDIAPPQLMASRRSAIVPKWLGVIGLGGLLAFLAAIILVETGKGTITIDSNADNVPIVIKKSHRVVKRLTVHRDGKSIRLWIGEYEIGFDKQPEDMKVENGIVTLGWQGDEKVQIRHAPGSLGNSGEPRRQTEARAPANRVSPTRGVEYPDPFQIGVTLGPADASRIPTYFASGFEVLQVASDSPAERAGIEVGDILLSWKGHQFFGSDPSDRILRYASPTRELKNMVEQIRQTPTGLGQFTMKFAVLDHRSGEVVEVSTAWGLANGSSKQHGLRVIRDRKHQRARR